MDDVITIQQERNSERRSRSHAFPSCKSLPSPTLLIVTSGFFRESPEVIKRERGQHSAAIGPCPVYPVMHPLTANHSNTKAASRVHRRPAGRDGDAN